MQLSRKPGPSCSDSCGRWGHPWAARKNIAWGQPTAFSRVSRAGPRTLRRAQSPSQQYATEFGVTAHLGTHHILHVVSGGDEQGTTTPAAFHRADAPERGTDSTDLA